MATTVCLSELVETILVLILIWKAIMCNLTFCAVPIYVRYQGAGLAIGLLAFCLRNDLYCVGWGVKLYTLTPDWLIYAYLLGMSLLTDMSLL